MYVCLYLYKVCARLVRYYASLAQGLRESCTLVVICSYVWEFSVRGGCAPDSFVYVCEVCARLARAACAFYFRELVSIAMCACASMVCAQGAQVASFGVSTRSLGGYTSQATCASSLRR